MTVRRLCVDRTGQVVAVDARAVPLAVLLERTDVRALLARLARELPPSPTMTGSYTPTAAQRRVVQARDRTCRFPGCHRRARRDDLDHRLPHPIGPTSVANLQPLCRHHHRLKHPGWACTRDADGTTTWTSPRGQRRTVQLS